MNSTGRTYVGFEPCGCPTLWSSDEQDMLASNAASRRAYLKRGGRMELVEYADIMSERYRLVLGHRTGKPCPKTRDAK